ncbi:hypothetical protein EC968_001905 [Mortierella alpina]|nr:hypothetical protein EC968_001905 [Mortierella alpina]
MQIPASISTRTLVGVGCYYQVMCNNPTSSLTDFLRCSCVGGGYLQRDDGFEPLNTLNKFNLLRAGNMISISSMFCSGTKRRFQDNAEKFPVTNFDLMSSASAVDKHALSTALAYFNKLGLEAIISLGTFVDVMDSQKWILKLNSGGVGMPSPGSYFMDKEKAAYVTLISGMFSLIVRDNNEHSTDPIEGTTGTWIQAAEDVFDFERELVTIMLLPNVQAEEDSDYDAVSVESLQRAMPSLNWSLFLERTLPAGVNRNRPVERSERWKYCVGLTSVALVNSIRPYLTEKILGNGSGLIVRSMAYSIKMALRSSLDHLTLFDHSTTAASLRKLDAIIASTGLSDEEEALNSYKNCQVNSSEFFGNRLRIGGCNTESAFYKLDKAIDRTSPTTPPHAVNIFFDLTENKIETPIGILQPPFFHSDYPEYINYGSLGAMLSHELTHGFDNWGRLFDGSGRKIEWWSDSVANTYRNRSGCFIEQYDRFGHNGILTLEENIADSSGLNHAFRA